MVIRSALNQIHARRSTSKTGIGSMVAPRITTAMQPAL